VASDATRGRRAASQRINFADLAKGPALPPGRGGPPGAAGRRQLLSGHRDAYSDGSYDDYYDQAGAYGGGYGKGG
jgi:hypothetical protein